MAWNDLKRTIMSQTEDATVGTAYRAAARSIPYALRGGSLIRTLRGFIVLVANARQVDQDFLASAALCVNDIGNSALATDGVLRSIKSALEVCLSPGKDDRVALTRKSLQASRDQFENRRLPSVGVSYADNIPTGYIDIWKISESELNQFTRRESAVSPIFPKNYEITQAWHNFQTSLMALEDSWGIWITWLRFRLMGISSYGIPDSVWIHFENEIAKKPESFWSMPSIEINIELAETVERLTEGAIEQEIARAQEKSGIVFSYDENGVIDIESVNLKNPIISDFGHELKNAIDVLENLCVTNSSEEVRQLISSYREVVSSAKFDAARFVFRGAELRRCERFQRNRDLDSNIPVIQDDVLIALETVVSAHNLILAVNPELKDLDAAMYGIPPETWPFSAEYIRKLLRATKERVAFTKRAREALVFVSGQSELFSQSNSEENGFIASVSLVNLTKTFSSFVWTHRKIIAAGAFAVPVALYGIGQWAIANQFTLIGYFPEGSALGTLVTRVIEFLKILPLA